MLLMADSTSVLAFSASTFQSKVRVKELWSFW